MKSILLFLIALFISLQVMCQTSYPLRTSYGNSEMAKENDGSKMVLVSIPSGTDDISVFRANWGTAMQMQPTIGIKLSYLKNNQYYGIFQEGSAYDILNYFQDPVQIGGTTLNGEIGSPSLMSLGNFSFKVQLVPSGPIASPLFLEQEQVTVDKKLITRDFQMTDGAGEFKVLTSDQFGNGTWTDPSLFNDNDWITEAGHGEPGFEPYMYNNPRYSLVGIGTSTPKSALHVVDGNIMLSRSFKEAPGSLNGSILFGDFIDDNARLGNWGIEYQSGLDANAPKGLNFWKPYTVLDPGGNYYLFLRDDGNVGIGTEDTHGYKLAVKGKILCTELKVKLAQDWGDYVFDKDYKLLPLQDLQKYILDHHHLPEIPSASEVKENGINTGEMNLKLVIKIEELTLYLLEQQKEIEALKAKLEKQ